MDEREPSPINGPHVTPRDKNSGSDQNSESKPGDFEKISKDYLDYLVKVTHDLSAQDNDIEELCSLIRSAGAVHLYGFGRSGTAALACAIRLRQFSDFLPDVWWVGDQVRNPIRANDLLIVFSKVGSRSELVALASLADKKGAKIALITSNRNARIGALARLIILLPVFHSNEVYGGGDFELSSFFFQEVLVRYLGKKMCIPRECVWMNHV